MKKIEKGLLNKNNIIFGSFIIFSTIIFIWGTVFKENFEGSMKSIYSICIEKFSWAYCAMMLIFFLVCIWAALSKFNNIKLGDDDSKPEFSNISWFAMLFSAGIGIGLVFWGVAEPLTHYINPLNMEGITEEARKFAFSKAFLHIGVSAWACYAVLALALAYIHYRRKKPLLISSLLIPLVGKEKAEGFLGKIVDIFTVFATMAGIITSLGMGTLQVTSGLNYLFNIPETNTVKILIISIITVLFLISACTGVKKGIKLLSNANIALAFLLFAMAIIIGPKNELLRNVFLGLQGYGVDLLTTNNNIFIKGQWYEKWTIFYWGWWIAWAPSVAIFIARVSKGRTIKEFILGVLFIPAGFCVAWMGVFGNLGVSAPIEVGKIAIQKVETSMFMIFEQYPFGNLMSVIAIILLITFFVTSADSATYVLGMITCNGETKVKNSRKIILGVALSLLTIVLLFAGGLTTIQNASIIAALPFGIVMIIAISGFIKELYVYETKIEYKERKQKSFNLKTIER
ncbi:BCCT family transporter [Clostridium chauvoei]|uniref:BCCT family transporter n=2 Tax=Clostridium chauvoei TaxID=46867 RepID=A0ABD4RH61_9CLOT|nr:BCCT family transporter [Clostridium chauvoei]ATD55490.1 choline transporter [Clostridium chauvoei]ATD56835.1 choline transporter [Clostridium chauvoei]MBX7280707.1 BCCT family transporter [Clostridium chauvoei]MBX7283190.1 BCCT family transporter [Clostridium chauvoei]MBX7285748.1 BCCT family transporter [Clostridium chauvoei]